MLSAALLLFANTLLFTLRLSGGSFPKPLSAAEEKLWLERFARGDPEARNVLIERNLRLVAHIVKKYYTQNTDSEDLISIGTIGLIKGISSFDPSKGARLATYAARCIENAILTPNPQFFYSNVRLHLFYPLYHMLQQLQFLLYSTIQLLNPICDQPRVYFRRFFLQLLLFFRFRRIQHHRNRCLRTQFLSPLLLVFSKP